MADIDLTPEYFQNDINIPDIGSPTKTTANRDALLSHIKEHKSVFFTEILGYKLYSELVVNYNTQNNDKWKSLVEGDEFTDSLGRINKFPGLRGQLVDGSFFYCSAANYVYWRWLRNNTSHTAGVGEVIPESENGVRTSPIQKMVWAWNEMVRINWIMHEYLLSKKSDFPDYIGLLQTPTPHPAEPFGNQVLFVKENQFNL